MTNHPLQLLAENPLVSTDQAIWRDLWAHPPDGAWAQFPSFALANGIDMNKITVEPVGFPTREPMLAEGKVDSVTDFRFHPT